MALHNYLGLTNELISGVRIALMRACKFAFWLPFACIRLSVILLVGGGGSGEERGCNLICNITCRLTAVQQIRLAGIKSQKHQGELMEDKAGVLLYQSSKLPGRTGSVVVRVTDSLLTSLLLFRAGSPARHQVSAHPCSVSHHHAILATEKVKQPTVGS